MKVSVIIPSHDHWQLTHNLLYSLYRLESEDIDEIVLVDDCSQEAETLGGLHWWVTNGMFEGRAIDFRMIRMEENLGFLKASNFGLKYAIGDIKILLSNDVTIGQPFIANLKKILVDDPRALVGPKLYSSTTGWNEFNGRIFSYLEGWMLCATKETWEELGYFDDRYCPNDYEDIDVSTTAISQGRHLITMDTPQIVHIGSQTITYGEKRFAITTANREKFRQKWVK